MVSAALVLASVLVMAPASAGHLLYKDVSSWTVDMDWTEMLPGMELMVRGTYHNVSLLFATDDALTFRIVAISTFRGTIGIRLEVPDVGTVSLVETDKVAIARFVGLATMDEIGLLVASDGLLSVRALGSITVSLDGMSATAEANALLLVKLQDGNIVWMKLGVPMGWPFQLPLP